MTFIQWLDTPQATGAFCLVLVYGFAVAFAVALLRMR